MDKKVFALKLRRLRVSRGYTNQNMFAKAVGATRAAVNAWEGGKYLPNEGILQKICEVLGCPREVLLDEEGMVAASLIVPAIPITRKGIPITDIETDDTDHYSLGKRIKHAREFRGLTQAALAAKIEVVTKTVSQWESDRRKPDAANLRRICCVLDVSGDYLLGLLNKQSQRLPSGVEVGALMGWWSEEAIRKSDGWSWEMWQERLEKAYEEKRQKAEELRSGEDVLDLVILACRESNVPCPLALTLTRLLEKIQTWQKFRGWSDSYEMIEALGYLPGYEGKEEAKFVHHQDWSSLLCRGPKHMSVNQHTNAMLERIAEMMGITLRGLLDDDIPPLNVDGQVSLDKGGLEI